MKMRRVTRAEREEIFRLRETERLGLVEIGKRTGRDKSSIWRVLRRAKETPAPGEADTEIVGRALAVIRAEGPVSQAELSRRLGMKGGRLSQSVLLYITDHCPAVAEEDDSRLFYVEEEA